MLAIFAGRSAFPVLRFKRQQTLPSKQAGRNYRIPFAQEQRQCGSRLGHQIKMFSREGFEVGKQPGVSRSSVPLSRACVLCGKNLLIVSSFSQSLPPPVDGGANMYENRRFEIV